MRRRTEKPIGYITFVIFFTAEFNRLKKTEKNNKFLLKLSECNKQIAEILNLMNAELNTTENTLKIIEETLMSGELKWEKNIKTQKFEFKIKIPSQAEPINFDKLSMHCSRAILLAASKKANPVNEETQRKQINDFREGIILAAQAQNNLNELASIGHLEYQDNFTKTVAYKGNSRVLKELEAFDKELNIKLKIWRGIIKKAKLDNYLLTYVPNKRLFELLDYFREPNEEKL